MTYISNTDAQRREMLQAIGHTMDELFAVIKPELAPKSFNLPAGKSELEVYRYFSRLAAKNRSDLVSFMGGGFYDHFIPAAVEGILSRGEFFTAYTPYQAEASQGSLQAIYEFQSSIARLTGMDVANASLYDGGTALYEAAMMAVHITGRRKIVIDGAVNPIYRTQMETYTRNLEIQFKEVPNRSGHIDRERLAREIDSETAAVIVQNPNFFGLVEDYTDVGDLAHKAGALLVVSFYPISLGILKTPAEMGADIATGEGQSLGLALNFGGPYLGLMATRKEHVRKMPGRLVARTTDDKGRQAFTLSLQAREQHVRRAKATSNICTNESLCALGALVYMSLMGKEGLREVAGLCAAKAAYAHKRLAAIPGVSFPFEGPFFNEFVVELPRAAADVASDLIEHGFAAGFPLSKYFRHRDNSLLVAFTEKHSRQDVGRFAETLEGLL